MSEKDSLDLPRELGPYLLLRRLAVGGMAEVYVAKSRGVGDFEKLVAIKVIHPRYSEDEHFVKLLVEEAKISVLLTHVNIAQIFDLGVGDETYYIAMEYIEGADCYRVQRRASEQKVALPIDVCTFVVSEVCNGLDYAHRKRDGAGKPLRIVHRDISPQNVLVSFAGEVKVVDFGIAKAALREGQTEAGVIKGKYYYMSPEQAWGDPMDHRTDVFSTGVVLYELLTGEMMYREDNIPLLLDKVRKAEVARPERKRPDIPAELSDIIMKALSKEPGDRWQSAHEMSQALTQFLYRASPSFTSARVVELMARLFPNEIKNATSTTAGSGKPAAKAKAAPGPAPAPKPARPPPAKPAAAAPAATPLADEDSDDSTRNDLLPFRKPVAAPAAPPAAAPPARPAPGPRPAPAAAAPPRGPEPPRAPAPVAPAPAPVPAAHAKDETPSWDEDEDDATNVIDRDEWGDESTTIDDAGGVMASLQKLYGDRGPPDGAKAPSPVAPAAQPRPRATTAAPQALPPAPQAAPPRPRVSTATPQQYAQAPQPQPYPQPQYAAQPQPQPQPQPYPQPQPQYAPPAQAQPPQYAPPQPQQPQYAPPQSPPYAPPQYAQPQQAPWPSSPPDPFASVPPAGFAQQPHGQRALATDVYPAQQDAPPPGTRWARIVALAAVLVLIVTGGAIWLVLEGEEEPVPGVVEVVTVPPGAHLRVDGHDVDGVTPLRVRDTNVTPHLLRLEVSLDGYDPWSGELLPKQGEMVSQVVVLVGTRVSLHVESNPPGATLRVGTSAVGVAPIDVRVAPGPIEIRAVWAGRPEVRETVQVVTGAPATVTIAPPQQ